MTINEMLSLLREKDAFRLADVEFALLETDGQISVMKKSDAQPLTPKAAGISVQNEEAPIVVIEDGIVQYNTLLEKWFVEGIARRPNEQIKIDSFGFSDEVSV